MVIRPKSITTVVVALFSTPAVSSPPSAAVRTSSVCSGRISETEPTKVVLPAPKPPAMRIFRASGTRTAWLLSARPESMDHRLQHIVARPGGRGRLVKGYQTGRPEITQEYPDRAEWKIDARREFRHRDRA